MEREDVFEAVHDAVRSAHEESSRAYAIRIGSFRARRELALGEEVEVEVVGLHYDPSEDEYSFVYVASDGDGEIYISRAPDLKGELPPAVGR